MSEWSELVFCHIPLSYAPSRSWSGSVEAIARCVAAFQNATDATEHSQCDEIIAKICSYTNGLAQKTSPYLREHLLKLLYDYIENRTYDLALKNIIDESLMGTTEQNRRKNLWSCTRVRRQRHECLDLLEICWKAMTSHGETLRNDMASLQLDRIAEVVSYHQRQSDKRKSDDMSATEQQVLEEFDANKSRKKYEEYEL